VSHEMRYWVVLLHPEGKGHPRTELRMRIVDAQVPIEAQRGEIHAPDDTRKTLLACRLRAHRGGTGFVTLVTSMHLQAVQHPSGFSLFHLEQGHIAPGMTLGGDLSLRSLFEKDATERRMGAMYLLYLAPVEPGASSVLTALLWRVGEVWHLTQALPGHYNLGDWLRQNKDKLDDGGYTVKPLTSATVLDEYARDLMLLTDQEAAVNERRLAFCRAFGVWPRNLNVSAFSQQKELPLYALFVCRAFMY